MVCFHLVATPGPVLVAGSAPLRAFGATNAVAVGLLIWLQADATASLWCVWAAITACVIDVWLRRQCTVTDFDIALRKREFSAEATR